MVYRDPETGQFQSGNPGSGHYNDIESWSFNVPVTFEGGEEDFSTRLVEILDIDHITDRRREEAHLIYGNVSVRVTDTVSGANAATVGILETGANLEDPLLIRTSETEQVQGSDSLDAVSRPFYAGNQPVDNDEFELEAHEMADPVFHPRNEIRARLEMENTSEDEEDVYGILIQGQMTFGLKDAEGSGR